MMTAAERAELRALRIAGKICDQPRGPVCLRKDDAGKLELIGRGIVNERSLDADAKRQAMLAPLHPLWDDALCHPNEYADSTSIVGPETLVYNRSVTIAGSITDSVADGAPRMTSVPHEDTTDPEIIEAELAQLRAAMGWD